MEKDLTYTAHSTVTHDCAYCQTGSNYGCLLLIARAPNLIGPNDMGSYSKRTLRYNPLPRQPLRTLPMSLLYNDVT